MPRVLIVDDEETFRTDLARRLRSRGYENIAVDNGEDAIKAVRADYEIDVVVLDRKMPGMHGEQVLKEIKTFRPAIQVIMLTGHAEFESAVESGRLEAYSYLAKPCEFSELLRVIDAAREDRVYVMARQEVAPLEKGSLVRWLKGSHNSRPGVIAFGVLLLVAFISVPSSDRLLHLLSFQKTGAYDDANAGYSSYRKMSVGQSIADYYGRSYGIGGTSVAEDGRKVFSPLSPRDAGLKARAMLGVLIVAALFWATGAIPIGITALLVGLVMYGMNILQPDDIARAYSKDAVVFIFGVLAMSRAITKTGLDRRLGLLILGPAKSLPRFFFLFLPLLGMTCAFVSEHALVAFIMPLIIMVYLSALRTAGIRRDRALIVMFVLSTCFAANCGGPGSPAAGGRNAVMLGILSDYCTPPTFAQWVKYGMLYVPVMALVIGAYFYLVFRRRTEVKNLDVSAIVRRASQAIGPMNRGEYLTAGALIALILLWVLASDRYGMGGPVLLVLVFLNVFRVLRWRDIAAIPWEVVALYASACALGTGLAATGAALYLADGFVGVLPQFMRTGEGLAIATSLFTGLTTNFMSDGATVSAIGPITVPMATISGTHPWMIGFATAFASSFAHMTIVGTPNNAIAYSLARDPATGEQLVTLWDFFKHGAIVLVLSFVVLWAWAFMGYWRLIGF